MPSPIAKELRLRDGSTVVLFSYDMCTDRESRQRNVACIDATGRERWRVGDYRPSDVSTFTNIYFDSEGELRGYNFDGGEYRIDVNTGTCTPLRLLK